MGGKDNSENLVELTIEQHADAHYKLYKEHGHWQDYCAWKALSGQIERKEIIKLKRKMAFKGKKHTPETITKLKESCKKRTERQRADGTLERANKKRSEAMKGKKKTPEAIENWKKSRRGYKHSPETIAKIKAKRALQKNVKGIIKSEE